MKTESPEVGIPNVGVRSKPRKRWGAVSPHKIYARLTRYYFVGAEKEELYADSEPNSFGGF
jgi:hypothetical protein